MSSTTKYKFLLLLTGLLFITNIILLSFLFRQHGNPHNEREAKIQQYLKNTLGFSPAQVAAYDKVRELNRKEVRAMFDSMNMQKELRLQALAQEGFSDSAILAMTQISSNNQQRIERKILERFKKLREICTPAQRNIFDTSIYKIMQRKSSHKD
ncbi:MAG: periplasmic heavy metal sensor [Niastella sp.]|nr:periplasmic heavy metal sensor [Niastella sp.]